jgi:DNA-binding transcriptional MerR regulator
MGTYRIGELARVFGLNPRTLRYYESLGLLTPARRGSGSYRIYTEADADRLRFILKAKRLGLGLREIRELLAEQESPCGCLARLVGEKKRAIRAQIEALQELEKRMDRLLALASERRRPASGLCPLVERVSLEA